MGNTHPSLAAYEDAETDRGEYQKYKITKDDDEKKQWLEGRTKYEYSGFESAVANHHEGGWKELKETDTQSVEEGSTWTDLVCKSVRIPTWHVKLLKSELEKQKNWKYWKTHISIEGDKISAITEDTLLYIHEYTGSVGFDLYVLLKVGKPPGRETHTSFDDLRSRDISWFPV